MPKAGRGSKVKIGENYDLFLHVPVEPEVAVVRTACEAAANADQVELIEGSGCGELDLSVQAALLSALDRRGVAAVKALQAEPELWRRLGEAVGLVSRMKAQAYAMAMQGQVVARPIQHACRLDGAMELLNRHFVDVDSIPMSSLASDGSSAPTLGG